MSTHLPSIVVGIGNSLYGDDGAGPEVVEHLQRTRPSLAMYRVVQQLLPEMAEEIASAKTVVFVDAAVDLPPGEVQTLRLNAAERCVDIRHRLDPPQLLAVINLLYDCSPKAWCVRIGVLRMEPNEPLSLPVSAAIGPAVDRVLNLLSTEVAARNA